MERLLRLIVRRYLMWSPARVAQEEMKAGIEPLEPVSSKPERPRASLLKRAWVLSAVLVCCELPVLLICAALYHKQTFHHPWVKVVLLGLEIPMWTMLALTVLVGGGALLFHFLFWLATGHEMYDTGSDEEY